jgi:hypothetical protein
MKKLFLKQTLHVDDVKNFIDELSINGIERGTEPLWTR